MSRTRTGRVEEIFLLAIDRDPAEWRAILDHECAGDRDLRKDVEELLKCHADTDDFMDSKAAPGKGLLTQIGANAAADEELALPPDRMVGRFKVQERIGAGGMGIVYIAEQDRPKRTVALKVLRTGHASPRMLRRFEYEADVLGRLQHPGIAQVYEAGAWTHEGVSRPFIAMELVRGLPIGKHSEDKKLSVRERLELIAKVCDAVQHAHQAGVIHRDLKPGNILVGEDGQPKLLDFGVARPLSNDLQLTTSLTGLGALIGTLPYMSPEQVLGDPNAIDTRSDVYAIGVVLYELLAGKLPYDIRSRSLPEAARIIRDEEPPKLSGYDRLFRGEIETIVGQALEKDRTRRYQSAAELGDDLRRHLASQPILARNASRWYTVQKQLHRHRAWVAAGSAALLGLILFAVLATVQAQSERNARIAADEAFREADAQRRISRETTEKMVAELRVSSIENARLRSRTGDLGSAEPTLWDEHFKSPKSPHTFWALWEMYYEHSIIGSTKAHASIASSALTLDGKLYATASDDGNIRLWKTPDLSPAGSFKAHRVENRVVALSFSPEGDSIVSACRDSQIILSSIADGRPLARAINSSPIRDMATNDDFSLLAAAGDGGYISVYALPTLEHLRDIQSPRAPGVIAFSPDGRIVYAQDGGQVRSLTPDGVNTFPADSKLSHGVVGTGAITFNPVNGDLITGGRDRMVRRSDTVTGQLLSSYLTPNGTIASLAVTSDGKRVLSGGWWRLEVQDATTLERQISFPSPGGVNTINVMGDDQFAIAGLSTGEVRVWELSHTGRFNLPGHSGRVAGSFSPDGAVLATTDSTGVINLWEMPTLRKLASWKAHAGRIKSVYFSHTPAGRRWLVSCGEDSFLRIWDYTTATLTKEFPQILDESGGSSDISPDGSTLVYCDITGIGTLAVVDTTTWKRITSLPRQGYAYVAAHFSRDGRTLVTTNRARVVESWNVSDWSRHTSVTPSNLNSPWVMSFSPDSSKVIVSNWNRICEIRNVPDLSLVKTLTGHTALVSCVEWSPVDPRLAVSISADGTLRLWDTVETRNILLLPVGTDNIEGIIVRWSPDGQSLLVTGSLGTCYVLDLSFYERAMANHYRMVRTTPELARRGNTPQAQELRQWAETVAARPWPRLGKLSTAPLTTAHANDAILSAWASYKSTLPADPPAN